MIEIERKDAMQVDVLPRLGGVGAVTPTDIYSDEEVLRNIEETQGQVAQNIAVCIDERPAESIQPVRPKKAGGILTDIFAIAITKSPTVSRDTHERGVQAVMEETAKTYDRLSMQTGGHGGEQVCGASANFPIIAKDAADQGHGFTSLAKEDLGDLFDQAVWGQVIIGASGFADELRVADQSDDESKRWDPKKFEELLRINAKTDKGVFEELTGENLHPDLDPENKRHGHWAEAIKRQHQKGISNDRDHAKIQYFQVDVWKIAEDSSKLSVDEKDFAKQLHAAALFQYATAYRLTSKQRLA